MKFTRSILVIFCLLVCTMASSQKISDKMFPTLTSSSLVSVSYSGEKVNNFNLATMEAEWKDNGKKGFTGQISFDMVVKHFMGLYAGYRFSPELLVKVGQQKMFFFNEITTSPRTLEASGYSMGMNYLGGYLYDLCGLNSRSRDWGISASGDLFRNDGGTGLISYYLGLYQGNGYSLKDDNNAKNLTGLFLVRPWKQLTLSVGGMSGKYTAEGENGSYLAERNRLSGSVFYDDGKYFFKGETVYGKTDRKESLGAYALTGFWFRQDMALALRADRFNRDISSKDNAVTKLDLCFSHVVSRAFRYRLQYSRTFLSGKQTSTISMGVSLRFSTSSAH